MQIWWERPLGRRSRRGEGGFSRGFRYRVRMASAARPKKLDEASLAAFLAENPRWSVDPATSMLTRTFSFGSFAEGIAFIVRAGFCAEKLDHHPDLAIAYKQVTVSVTTHDAGGLSSLDLSLAQQLDEVAKPG
jgi:4a-hydroxytetrahydrobiopterin dehydratase